jgi:hypothetical protein
VTELGGGRTARTLATLIETGSSAFLAGAPQPPPVGKLGCSRERRYERPKSRARPPYSKEAIEDRHVPSTLHTHARTQGGASSYSPLTRQRAHDHTRVSGNTTRAQPCSGIGASLGARALCALLGRAPLLGFKRRIFLEWKPTRRDQSATGRGGAVWLAALFIRSSGLRYFVI